MLVNALSVVKIFYFYTKISRLIQITKPVIHSHFRKYSPLHFMKRAGAALVRTITSWRNKEIFKNRCTYSRRFDVNFYVRIFCSYLGYPVNDYTLTLPIYS